MKNINKFLSVILIVILSVSCEIGEQVDPNSPSVAALLGTPTTSELNNLVSGSLSQMRDQSNVYYDEIGVMGREMYRFSGSDPRWHSDLLTATALDNNAFYTTRPFQARYRTVKNLNILIEGSTNSSVITAAQRDGYLGFARTLLAHELLIVSNHQYDGGIRTDVVDPDNLGPYTADEQASLTFIAGQLDQADAELSNAEFAFNLTTGFDGFNSPAGLREINRALAARVAAYRGNFSEIPGLLAASFIDVNAIDPASFGEGAFMVFASGGGDQENPLFLPLNNTGENRVVHPSYNADIEAGDTRIGKVFQRTDSVIVSGLSSIFDVWIYRSLTAPVPIIRYEELVFLHVETMIAASDLTTAESVLNTVRNAYGLPDYSGAITAAALTDEMLNQRRWSLYFEGHRWVDMRRYDKLDELPLDRPGDFVWDRFPRTFDEEAVGG